MSSVEFAADLSSEDSAAIECKIASTREERASAFRLIYDSYLRAGLGQPNAYHMRVTPYHLLPTTQVLIATLRRHVIFTISLVADGELGLPMESVYGDEVASLRSQGARLSEASCLADRRSQFRGLFPVFLRICRVMVQHAQRQGIDQLLAAAHPRHARFYKRYMDFETFGGEKVYPTVRNHPAVALQLDFKRIARERPANYDTFFGEPISDVSLQPQPISVAECVYFRKMLDPSFNLAPLGYDGGLARVGELVPPMSVA